MFEFLRLRRVGHDGLRCYRPGGLVHRKQYAPPRRRRTGRWVGQDTIDRWFGDRLSVGLIGSQNSLMGIVFFSRLLPFLSFDLVSYAAGMTVLEFWRFAVATLAGIAPTSFLLAHLRLHSLQLA
ncbi:MAG: VTT domain-containing protein [Rubrivivax sp.]